MWVGLTGVILTKVATHRVGGKIKKFARNHYRPIPFEDLFTILVSIFHLLSDERKGRERVSVLHGGRKGGGRLLIQMESVKKLICQGTLKTDFKVNDHQIFAPKLSRDAL